MEVSSSGQVYVFLLCVLSGMLCGIFFDVQRFLREKYRAGKTRTFLEDTLFTFFCVAVVIGFGYFFNNGELRYFQLMGTVSGVLFYAAFLSNVFKRLLGVVFTIFINIVFKPARKIYHLILIPLNAGLRTVKKLKIKKKRLIKRISRHIKTRKKRFKKRIKML